MIYRREFAGAHRYDVVDRACPVLVVGEDNPQSSDPRDALFPYPVGCAGHRYADMITDIGAATHLATWRTNLCNPRWSAKAARERVLELLVKDAPWTVIVMLGRKVAGAFSQVLALEIDGRKFEFDAFTFFDMHKSNGEPFGSRDFTIVSLPHPSGRNLVWNDQAQIHRARALLARVAPSWYGSEVAADAVSGG